MGNLAFKAQTNGNYQKNFIQEGMPSIGILDVNKIESR
jgi:hypothetical protein